MRCAITGESDFRQNTFFCLIAESIFAAMEEEAPRVVIDRRIGIELECGSRTAVLLSGKNIGNKSLVEFDSLRDASSPLFRRQWR